MFCELLELPIHKSIDSLNQLTGFYMMATLTFNELKKSGKVTINCVRKAIPNGSGYWTVKNINASRL